jgi:protein-S-isoprenylcysteine O-methyltransferase Ste14
MENRWGSVVRDWQWKKYWASTAGTVLTLAEIALWIAYGSGEVRWIALAGVTLWCVGVIFAWVPIFQLKRHGGVAKGDSYVKTTKLVDTGLYAIVRHPQFISWPMFSIAVALIVQRWPVWVVGALSVVLFCVDFRKVDASDIDKFGDAYREYMERVPGWNPIAGAWRWLRRMTREPQ